ncbi:hypothetical protein MC885_021690 [Smutsia gigantea]|nr:hypothetical protein MC885_021690 [Smutsia gigantea]
MCRLSGHGATSQRDLGPPHSGLPAREPEAYSIAQMPAELVTRLPRPAPAAEPMSLSGPCSPTRLHCQDITPHCANRRFLAAARVAGQPLQPDQKQAPLRLPAASFSSQEPSPAPNLLAALRPAVYPVSVSHSAFI